MITSLLLGLLSIIIEFIAFLLPVWSVWPAEFLSGIEYFCAKLAIMNFIFPISEFFIAITFFINFIVYFYIAKITFRIFNFVRGTGSGLEI